MASPGPKLDESAPAAAPSAKPRTLAFWLPAAYVTALIVFEAWNMIPGLSRAWFFLSDEYVIVAEVIRFLHLDFHQHFFDMPGTPLIFLSALLWGLVYACGFLLHLIPHGAGLEAFTFAHLQLLFEMIRSITLVCALASIALVFVVASKLTNRAGAAVAALLVMMSPTYAAYTSFIRVESMAMCLILCSILALLRAVQAPKSASSRPEIRWLLVSGVLAGLAAACRFHSVTASLPVLLLLLIFRVRPAPRYPRTIVVAWNLALVFALVADWAFVVGARTGYLQRSPFGRGLIAGWPLAFQTLGPLAVAAGVVLLCACGLRLLSRTRPALRRLTQPGMLVLLGGSVIGCLAGVPTLLWQYRYYLASITMYTTTYYDRDRVGWPLLKNVAWVVNYYLHLIAPSPVTLALLGLGAVLIAARRDRLGLPVLAAGILFFVSKPFTLFAAVHHFLLWLPFYGIIAGYPVALAYDALRRRPHRATAANVALIAVLILLCSIMVPGPRSARRTTAAAELRMHNIALATNWLHSSTPSNASVAVAYFAFNPDIFYFVTRSMQVPEPASVFDGRQYIVWWGGRSELQGRKGYALATPLDFPATNHPGDRLSPYRDSRFRRLETFGTRPNQVDVFAFDLTAPRAGG